MYYLDTVAGEILGIEGQDAADPVHRHRRDEARVIDPVADHFMRHHEALPMVVDRRVVGQQGEHPLDVVQRRRGHRDRQAEAILRRRPGGHRPKFGDVLRRDINRLAALDEPRDAIDGGAMMDMVGFELAQQHVGIDENRHSRGWP